SRRETRSPEPALQATVPPNPRARLQPTSRKDGTVGPDQPIRSDEPKREDEVGASRPIPENRPENKEPAEGSRDTVGDEGGGQPARTSALRAAREGGRLRR